MSYLTDQERDARLEQVRTMLPDQKLDMALVYYDEFNIGNGWYLAGWCPQFESGAVSVPREGTPMIRANWHLLPYDQFLGWDAERMRYVLKEEDFLWLDSAFLMGSKRRQAARLRGAA